MVRTIKNIVIIVVVFEFYTGLGHDYINPDWDIRPEHGLGRDLRPGFVLSKISNTNPHCLGWDEKRPERD